MVASGLIGLVVEDEWFLRLELAEEFASAGWTVREAASGAEALRLMAELQEHGQKPHFLVTDIRLGGGMDGWDVAEICRKIWPGLPVIYVSANPIAESRQVAGSAFLGKPVAVEKLIDLCRQLTAGPH